jgi:hypothetical protein
VLDIAVVDPLPRYVVLCDIVRPAVAFDVSVEQCMPNDRFPKLQPKHSSGTYSSMLTLTLAVGPGASCYRAHSLTATAQQCSMLAGRAGIMLVWCEHRTKGE